MGRIYDNSEFSRRTHLRLRAVGPANGFGPDQGRWSFCFAVSGILPHFGCLVACVDKLFADGQGPLPALVQSGDRPALSRISGGGRLRCYQSATWDTRPNRRHMDRPALMNVFTRIG